jgi:hypothetical protein
LSRTAEGRRIRIDDYEADVKEFSIVREEELRIKLIFDSAQEEAYRRDIQRIRNGIVGRFTRRQSTTNRKEDLQRTSNKKVPQFTFKSELNY